MTKISEFITQITGGLNATDRLEVARPGQAVEFYATPENIKQYVVTPNIAALDALTTTGGIERTGPGTAATFAISAFAKTLLDDADAATARGTLGLLIGTNVQAWSTRLDSVAALSATSGAIEKTGANTFGTYTVTAAAKQLLDDTTFPAMRTTLGATTVGSNLFTLANPGAITFPRFNADNSVSALSATDFRTAISAQLANGNLTALADLAPSDGNFIVGNGSAWTVESGATARSSLGIDVRCVARVTFNGETLVVAGSHNVASVADFPGTPGVYTLTFSNALPSGYTAIVTAYKAGSFPRVGSLLSELKTTSSCAVGIVDSAFSSWARADLIEVAFFA